MSGWRASRKAALSIAALTAAGLGAVALVLAGLDRWLLGGYYTGQVATACSSIGSACGAMARGLYTYVGNPSQLITILGAGALLFAAARGAFVLRSSRRATREFWSLDESPISPIARRRLLKRLERADVALTTAQIRYSPDERPVAFTAGLVRPAVCVTRGLLDRLSDDQLSAVLAHEAAHVERRDNLQIFTSMILRDFLFIFPLAHYLAAVYLREKELAADDRAVQRTGKAADLAEAIVTMTRFGKGRAPVPAHASFAEPASAKTRVSRLLDESFRTPRESRTLLVAAGVTVLMVLALGTSAWALPSGQPETTGKCLGNAACAGAGYSCCRNP